MGHGGQTLLSGATEPLVVDALPEDSWLTDLGTHVLRDLPRPERAVQLCHRDLGNEFPPLRSANTVATHNLPGQLTSFVGRRREIAELGAIVAGQRLDTLTGAGGTGKTRLAIEVAAQEAGKFCDGLWYVDLAPITHGYRRVADTLECLAQLETDGGIQPWAARLLGAAHAFRQRTGAVRFPMHQAGSDDTVGDHPKYPGNRWFRRGLGRGRCPDHRGGDRLPTARPRRTQTRRIRLGVADAGRA